ncbi:MAG: amidohydrolase [Opitutales bacterium]|nr:amidohydrolase [Opitutales bacterium]
MTDSKALLDGVDASLRKLATHVRDWRRYLHRHPEPSGEEFKTTSYIVHILEEHNVPFRIAPSGRGVVVDSHPEGSVPYRVALRADIDALRMQDEKTVTYHSRERNRMHACGHDAHTAMLLGATLGLYSNREHLQEISWRAIFQPAEETATGALEMMDAGAIDGVDCIVALHVDPYYNVGTVAYREGALTANCVEFSVQVEGCGGHGARPHQAHDPLAAAASFVQQTYAEIPRISDSRDPSILTFGVFQSGINPNVIPERAQLRGTLRSVAPETAQKMKAWLERLGHAVGLVHGVSIQIDFPANLGNVLNDPQITRTCRIAAQEVVGRDNIIPIEQCSMGGEDFANYLKHIPGCMLRLGCGSPGTTPYPLHSPFFDIDEGSLSIGAHVLAHCAVHLASTHTPEDGP